jgi:ornithine cyclodeaminase/alanine dehydrogenase-like protein (mu-crystallin family)
MWADQCGYGQGMPGRVQNRLMTISRPVLLDDDEVRARLRAPEAVAAMREALIAFHRGQLESPPRANAVLTFTAGRLVGHWYGFRAYAVHAPGDQVVILQTEPDGRLAALATGPSLGAYRTGALGGAAVDAMARSDAATLGIIGTGQQAWTQVWAIAGVRALREVAVWSRSAEHRDRFAARVTHELGVPARTVADAASAVRERDIVVVATSARSPVIDAAWVSRGTAVTTLGPKQVGAAEFGLDLVDAADVIVTDSPPQLAAFNPPALLSDGPVGSLGAVLAGDAPGRTNPDQITLYQSVGLAGTEPFLLARLVGLG